MRPQAQGHEDGHEEEEVLNFFAARGTSVISRVASRRAFGESPGRSVAPLSDHRRSIVTSIGSSRLFPHPSVPFPLLLLLLAHSRWAGRARPRFTPARPAAVPTPSTRLAAKVATGRRAARSRSLISASTVGVQFLAWGRRRSSARRGYLVARRAEGRQHVLLPTLRLLPRKIFKLGRRPAARLCGRVSTRFGYVPYGFWAFLGSRERTAGGARGRERRRRQRLRPRVASASVRA